MDDSDNNNSPIGKLLAGLRKARNYQRGKDSSDDKEAVHGGRLAAIVALDAVLDFLGHIPEVREEKLHEPVANLKQALLDYEHGLNPTLFNRPPWESGGRPPDPSDREVLKAVAASAMELYMRAGHDRKAAAGKVARYLKGPEITADKVADWRDHAKAGLPSEDRDADLYEFLVARQVGYAEHEAIAQQILNWFTARYPWA